MSALAGSVLDMVSEPALEAFARRKCHHIGRMLSCSHLYGARAVLLGDAGEGGLGNCVNALELGCDVVQHNSR